MPNRLRTGAKVQKVLREYKNRALHSGSKKGPLVTNRKQAIAIALSEQRKIGGRVAAKPKVRVGRSRRMK